MDCGGAGDLGEVGGAGGTGEDGGIDARGEGGAQQFRCGSGDGVLVGVDCVHCCAGFARRVGDDIAGDGGTGQQNVLAVDARGQRGGEAFGDVVFGCEGDVESGVTGCLGGGMADGGDVGPRIAKRELEGRGSLGDCADCVGAGEDEPV